MTTTLIPKKAKPMNTEVALHLMINQLSLSNLPASVRRRNHLLNEIPPALSVHTDSQKLAAVLSTLIQSVLGNAQDTCIRISAKEFSNITLVHIRDDKRRNGNSFFTQLGRAQEMAEAIGGTVFVNTYRDGSTTIALSILNRQ